MPDYLAFFSYVVITNFTPGPNNIMSMANASNLGLKKGLRFNMGVLFGFACIMILCSVFSTVFIKALPSIKPLLKYVGATYIVYLAFKIVKSSYKNKQDHHLKGYGFKEGLLLQFVNPKVILYGITTLSTFVTPYYHQVTALWISLGLALIGFSATVCWSLFGLSFHKVLSRWPKQVNGVMAVLLVYTAYSLIVA